MSKLSIKHQAFINGYLLSFNATKAYLEVYPDSTYESAMSSSSDLLGNPNIVKELQSRIDAVKDRLPSDLIQHLKNLVFFNIADLLDDEGNIDKLKIKTNSIPGIVTGLNIKNDLYKGPEGKTERETESIAFKLTDHTKAIEILSKMLRLYPERLEVTGKDGGPIEYKVEWPNEGKE